MLRILKNIFTKKQFPRVEFRPKGRSGYIAYVDTSQECKMEFEMSGNKEFDILAYTDTLENWSNGKSVSNEEKQIILNAFQDWAELKKFRVQW